eukprot:5174966-Prymnesium_polylepis.1
MASSATSAEFLSFDSALADRSRKAAATPERDPPPPARGGASEDRKKLNVGGTIFETSVSTLRQGVRW